MLNQYSNIKKLEFLFFNFKSISSLLMKLCIFRSFDEIALSNVLLKTSAHSFYIKITLRKILTQCTDFEAQHCPVLFYAMK